MSWRRCPRCGNTLQGDARFCPKDGSPLVEMSGPPSAGSAGAARGVAEAAQTTVRKAVTPLRNADPAATLSAQILDTRYSVMRKLGEGGMSYVYEAREVNSGDSVAIKVLSPKLGKDSSSVERLRREAGLAMRLDHPNVCRILRLGETEDGLIYLVMPYLRGELLSDREVKKGPMTAEQGVDILTQVCAGLHHAHQLHIVHRDLKPENVMLVPQPDGTERAVVMDFGLAKENRSGSGLAKLTATGIILGTPEFMSPEQIRGKDLDARSDVYALGIMGFEMFTGRLPFQGRNAQEMMIARLRGQPTALRQLRADLSPRLEKTLSKAMESDPANRYPTARDFGLALVETLDQPPTRVRALLA
ncbi:MAG TPA: protein kinase [Gemmatimonadales bacterium]|nr:protein kinase [Gemmatimonadales bacterium]